ncbi:hypothetical protein AGMMS49921_13910 [Endomicrobiia bacterium]|nr:hypothetical protein AGMMS49921_13910 [Endomicrobiia bacterium]
MRCKEYDGLEGELKAAESAAGLLAKEIKDRGFAGRHDRVSTVGEEKS